MPEAQTEKTEDGRTRLYPSTASTDSPGMWISLLAYGIALGLWLGLAQSTFAWTFGSVVAVIFGGAVLYDVRKWTRARSLRKRLGEIVLSVDPYPARIGEAVDVRVAQRVRSDVCVRATTLCLLCSAARIETYGIRDRERRIWSNAFDTEVVVLRNVSFEAGDLLTAGTEFEIPPDSYGSSDWTRWWVVVDTSLEGCPSSSATFALEVVRADDPARAHGVDQAS